MKKNYDKDAWLKEQEEKLRDYKNKVLEIAKSFQTNPEEIAELLAFKTKFYRYSLRNTMMIYSYNPYGTKERTKAAYFSSGQNHLFNS